jgi:hypothetical protein
MAYPFPYQANVVDLALDLRQAAMLAFRCLWAFKLDS